MKQTINFQDFKQAFDQWNRENNFPHKLESLFKHLEQYEEEMGEEMELDVIALCCDYTEFENLADFQNNYGQEYQSVKEIEEKTYVIGWTDEKSPFIIRSF